MSDKEINVMIGVPCKGSIMSRTVSCIDALREYSKDFGIKTSLVFSEGTLVPHVRTALVKEFLKRPYFDFLLMLDSDQTFNRDILVKLLSYKKDLVGVPSRVRSNDCYNVYSFDVGSGLYKDIKLDGLDGLVECDAVGFGMVLLSRDLLLLVNKFEIGNGRSEDIDFCEKCRNFGFKVFFDAGERLGHLVVVELK